MTDNTVIVVGGGTGGLVAACRLRQRLDRRARVILVTRETRSCFAPSLLWVMTGDRQPDTVCLDLRQLRAKGIEVVEAEAAGVDLSACELQTSAGSLSYDRLVLAVGADLAPQDLPGFIEAAHSPYTLEGATKTAAALESFRGGKLAVLVARLPFKCPAAPYETALLAAAALRRRGVQAQIDLYTPEPLPMPTAGPVLGEAIKQLLAVRGIGFHPGCTAERIDPQARTIDFGNGEQAGYDLLLGVPPHVAPALARDSGLAGESGFIPVDPHTLATRAEGVYAIGDVTAIPIGGGRLLPKAGVFAHGHADVVARRIADELAGRIPTATFDGNGSCFLETGKGAAGYASGNFYAPGGPQITLRQPSRVWHLGKVLLEQYWLRRWV